MATQLAALEYITVEPRQKPNACVIWLHGLGADGYDFKPIVSQLKLPKDLSARFVFPHAPLQPVTLNQGTVMRSWFDIVALNRFAEQDIVGMQRSSQLVDKVIATQVQDGISTKRIILIGFSQGGAMVLFTGLRYPQPLAGIIALSTYVPVVNQLKQEGHKANQKIPIMMAHGLQDETVKYSWGCDSRDYLRSLDYNVDWYEYPIAHSVGYHEILDISNYLTKLLV